MGLSINFYVRKAKANKHGFAPLEIAVNVDGKRKFCNLPRQVSLTDWNRKRRPKDLVEYMDIMRVRANEIITELLRHGEPLTTETLMSHFRNGGYRSYTADDLFGEYLDILRERVGRSITKGVYRKYELVKELFCEGIDSSRECDTVLTHAAVLRFKAKVEGRYEQATAAGYLTKLKTFIKFGMDSGKLHGNPFGDIKIVKGTKPIVYLHDWECKMLESGRLENASLSKVRDFAILQLSSGMAYADCVAVTKDDIRVKDGIYYIEKPRVKTGKVFTSVIIEPERFMAILDRYDGRAPQISNQKLNCYLKTVGDLLNISTTLTTHVFRKTYATNLINAGVRLETVASACGHGVAICKKYYAELQKDTVISEIAKKIG